MKIYKVYDRSCLEIRAHGAAPDTTFLADMFYVLAWNKVNHLFSYIEILKYVF
jgi:hypothetical protein